MKEKTLLIKAVLYAAMSGFGFLAHHYLDHPDNFFESEAERVIDEELEAFEKELDAPQKEG